jgi:hypothetical protein
VGPQTNEQERLLHQAANALLAVPVFLAAHVGAFLRRSTLTRVGLALGLSLVLGVGVLGAGQPATAVATRTNPIVRLPQAAFTTTFSADRGLAEPVKMTFTTPMDVASVADALTVEPANPVDLSWDETGTILTVSPRGRWAVEAFTTVTVPAGALAASGQPLDQPARAVFLTREATSASITPTGQLGTRVSLDTSFLVSFTQPVDPETVQHAIRLDPPTPGSIRSNTGFDGPTRFEFAPSVPLRSDVSYRLIVSGVRDTDGLPLDEVALAVRTTKAPAVVRFRPFADTTNISRDAVISVRFTEKMDRGNTARAFSVSVGGKAVAGSVHWAESDTVLVFTPKAPLPYGSKVSMDVTAKARDTAGVPIAAAGHAVFRTSKKGVAPARDTSGGGSSGGGAVGGGSWAAVETYYLGLMNCTRTGGWVTSTGHCSSPGGRDVAPLKLSTGISSKVSRPYAKKLAIGADCSHFIGGNPGDRLRRAGYASYRWAENLGCRSGGARSAVLSSHLFFQSERSYNGGHYRNMMNAAYSQVGIGVWVSGGRVRLVVDFYHP